MGSRNDGDSTTGDMPCIVPIMRWIKRHSTAIAGALFLLVPLAKFIFWLLNVLSGADFVVTRVADPGWVGDMLNLLIDPPEFVLLPTILIGLALIWWDIRRSRRHYDAPPSPLSIDWDKEAIGVEGDEKPRVLAWHLFIQNNSKSETLRGVELVLEKISSIDEKTRKPIGRALLADAGTKERFDLAPEQKRRVVLLRTPIDHLWNEGKYAKYRGLIAWGPFKGDPSIEETDRGLWLAKLSAYVDGMAPHNEVFAVDARKDGATINRYLGDHDKI